MRAHTGCIMPSECSASISRPQCRASWALTRSASCSRSQARRQQQQQRPCAQALGSRDEDDRPLQRGAGPLRVFSPLAEATATLAAEPLLGAALLGTSVLGSIDPADNAVSISKIMEPVAADMELMRQNLRNVVGKRHPLLLAAADQIFSAGGKRIRPLICLLVARATCPLSGLR